MADITFSAASTAGLNNPGTEIVTLVKDGSGNFINPPSYDKMRAYLRSGEVPMLFVTDEGGETGSLYQLVEYSETENKIRFSNDTNAIEFCAGCETPVVSEVVPKPLTYDYMPEGYPKKSVGTATVMAEQEVAFVLEDAAVYTAYPTEAFEIVEGQTYTVNWDGADYECVCSVYLSTILSIGNKSIYGAGDDTGEPFLYLSTGAFATHETAANHTISVKTMGEVITPMAGEFLPVASEDNYGAVKKSEIVTAYKFDALAPHDQMVGAITEFRKGIASIMWRSALVAAAEYDSSTDKITVKFAADPNRVFTAENIDGHYDRYRAAPKYERELILHSITPDSTKNFRITVDDSGTISATEVPA